MDLTKLEDHQRHVPIKGYATKDDYTKALRSYQAYLDEIKRDHRDEANRGLDNCQSITSIVCHR